MERFVTCTPMSVNQGIFDDAPPEMARYRCELTALSHTCNFYFVAIQDTIHIYRPNVLQNPRKAVFVLRPQPSAEGQNTPGYIDPYHPHVFNRILVDYLGNKEVLVAASDDGDVVAYYISTLERAVEEGTDPGSVKPFFVTNVQASAWGLAVHQKARILAVSSNTHNVTIIPFDLDQSGHGVEAMMAVRPPERTTLALETNIPFVTFDNVNLGLAGVTLRTGTIEGRSTVFQYDPSTKWFSESSEFLSHSSEDNDALGRRYRPFDSRAIHGTWGAFFMDPYSGRRAVEPEEAFGDMFVKRAQYKHVDLTFVKVVERKLREKTLYLSCRLPLTLSRFLSEENKDFDAASESCHDTSGSDTPLSLGDEQEDYNHHGQVDMTRTLAGGIDDTPTPAVPNPVSVSVPSGEESQLYLIEPQSDEAVTHESLITLDDPIDSPPEVPQEAAANANAVSGSTNDDAENNAADASAGLIAWAQSEVGGEILNGLGDWINAKVKRTNLPKESPCKRLPDLKAAVIITNLGVYLIQENGETPLISMQAPLYNRHDRIIIPQPTDQTKYYLYIPELSVFAVASNFGRCAIFSITRFLHKDNTWRYGFRQEHLLPTREQEELPFWRKGPINPLVGIAAGPLQGQFDEPDEPEAGQDAYVRRPIVRRWRLFLYYSDHTILTYELAGVFEETLAEFVV
ncbi:hypothetical protein M011DRAFT_468479 [Sporormia fimetaria CBS 119925]|uniref:Uncharacterized protein n=1 Tax=Sporormia fimetaria CBS 119925 TaxID=1340428 RepID=A0A6A6VAR0_9PLEO|nr:hypothetical protein M011DRAFT_468479 [Sporormia fimetaria CBS 119925]